MGISSSCETQALDTSVADIANLLKRERFYRDTGRWDLCRAAYHPDASRTYIDVAWFQGQVDDFLAQSAKTSNGRINVIHSSFDPVGIAVQGDRATSEAFCSITSEITIAGVEYELASHMRLLSRLERSDAGTGGGWHMVRLESIYVRDRLVSSLPGVDARLDPDLVRRVGEYPAAYRKLALVMLHRGLSPRPDLPHEGDQSRVRRLLEANQAFLQDRPGEEGTGKAAAAAVAAG
ncbi:hypothetical protein E4U41_004595 [Claviceps citrina]|nr:hypothetical protein E4U41_004595 [Claviceps citrina]